MRGVQISSAARIWAKICATDQPPSAEGALSCSSLQPVTAEATRPGFAASRASKSSLCAVSIVAPCKHNLAGTHPHTSMGYMPARHLQFVRRKKYGCAVLFAHVVKEHRADIALAQIGQYHHNHLACVFGTLRHLHRRVRCRASANAHQ